MTKTYVLDTNVLINSPDAFLKFEDNDVVIPIFVIEELDHIKREQSDRGTAARAAVRKLDKLRANGSLAEGVDLPNGGTLRIVVPVGIPTLYAAMGKQSADQAILATALYLTRELVDSRVVLVTDDLNLGVRADAYGVHTEPFQHPRNAFAEVVASNSAPEIMVSSATIDLLHRQGFAPAEVFEGEEESPLPSSRGVCSHVSLVSYDRDNHKALARFKDNTFFKLKVPPKVLGVVPRNQEQFFALDLLLDPAFHLITLIGISGTGKTMLAALVGLQQFFEKKVKEIIITRPIVPLGKDIGYLPGSLEEKMDPWMQPLYDNLERIIEAGAVGISLNDLKERGIIKMVPLTYIRGRSLSNSFIICDEAQNMSAHEAKTLISRCGEGTRIVLTGDPYQIDNPYVDSTTNGLSVVASKLKGEPLVGHVTLTKGERSPLAEIATRLL